MLFTLNFFKGAGALALAFVCCCNWFTPVPQQTAPAEQPAQQACAPTNMVGWPLDYVTADGGCVYKAPGSNSPAEQPANVQPVPASAGQTVSCNGITITLPEGGQVFESTVWRDGVAVHDCTYDFVYDPHQSGVTYLEPKGWYYQPFMNVSHREYFEAALVIHEGPVKFVGPECTLYHRGNANNESQAGKNGTVLVNRQNMETLLVPSTTGAPNGEAWVFITSQESDAGGCSIANR